MALLGFYGWVVVLSSSVVSENRWRLLAHTPRKVLGAAVDQ
jgi:hypothetical protein